MRKLILVAFLYLLINSCSIKNESNIGDINNFVKLDFSECTIASEAFNYITINIPKGYKMKFKNNEGICEYRFIYKDGSIAYISNDIWFGSSINFENRHKIGHQVYSKENLIDTINLKGVQEDKLNWSEQIIGDIMVGYVNASDINKSYFEQAFDTIIKYK